MSSYSSETYGSTSDYDWTGQLINDNYILIKKLGFGSFAAVWLAYSLKHKKCYAIKILNPEDYKSGTKEINIFKEFKKFKNSHIIEMIDHFSIPVPSEDTDYNPDNYNGEHICIVLELMLCSVYDIIKIYHKTNNYLPLEFIKEVIYQMLLATDLLHENNIIHTDIKPENLLISFDNELEIAKLIDQKNNLVSICNSFNNSNISTSILKIMKDLRKKVRNPRNDLKRMAIKEIVSKILKPFDIENNIKNKINDNNNNNKNKDKKNNKDKDKKNNKNKDNKIKIKNKNNKDISESDSDISDYIIKRDEISDSSDIDNELNDNELNNNILPNILSKDYFKNIVIKISDLGTCINKNKTKNKEIQTRHYRAPEVIFKLKYGEKCDIWSIGCCIYELLTKELLFNPNETNMISCDRFHVYNLIGKLGLIPNDMLANSPIKDIFFKRNGYPRGIANIHLEPIWSLMEDIKSNIYKTNDIILIFDLMFKMLAYNPSERLSAKESLSHIWFKTNNHNPSHAKVVNNNKNRKKRRR